MYHPLSLNGYSKIINAVKRQRNLGLEVRQYTHTRTPHRNLQPDRCGPVIHLATISLDFTSPHFTYTSVEDKLINMFMSYRLEMKCFFILKLVANRGFRL